MELIVEYASFTLEEIGLARNDGFHEKEGSIESKRIKLVDSQVFAKPDGNVHCIVRHSIENTVVYGPVIDEGLRTGSGLRPDQVFATRDGDWPLPATATEVENLPVEALQLPEGEAQHLGGIGCEAHVILEHEDGFEVPEPGVIDDAAMRECAADVVVEGSLGGGETMDLTGDSQLLKTPLGLLPALSLAINIDAPGLVEDVERTRNLGLDRFDKGLGLFLAHAFFEMTDQGRGITAELIVCDEVIARPILISNRVRDTHRALKTVGPAEKGQAEAAGAVAAEFFVEVAFLAAEAVEAGVESGPGPAAAGKRAEAHHADFEGRRLGVVAARVEAPSSRGIIGPPARRDRNE